MKVTIVLFFLKKGSALICIVNHMHPFLIFAAVYLTSIRVPSISCSLRVMYFGFMAKILCTNFVHIPHYFPACYMYCPSTPLFMTPIINVVEPKHVYVTSQLRMVCRYFSSALIRILPTLNRNPNTCTPKLC
jgi:hypothetical protein